MFLRKQIQRCLCLTSTCQKTTHWWYNSHIVSIFCIEPCKTRTLSAVTNSDHDSLRHDIQLQDALNPYDVSIWCQPISLTKQFPSIKDLALSIRSIFGSFFYFENLCLISDERCLSLQFDIVSQKLNVGKLTRSK